MSSPSDTELGGAAAEQPSRRGPVRLVVPSPSPSPSPHAFSASASAASPKRKSPYRLADDGRYSSLVKAVVRPRVPPNPRTPETLGEEDERIYGPVVAAASSADASSADAESRRAQVTTRGSREHQLIWPTITCEEGPSDPLDPLTLDPLTPTRVPLQRGEGRARVPSVTRVLQGTLSPQQLFYLERWKKRMIAELGEEGFREYSECLFRQGKLFHNAVEDIITAGTSAKDADPTEVEGFVESVSHILEDIRGVRAIESTVQHRALNYLGIVDCVARYRGVLCVIEWKTSERPKPHLSNTYDNPLQVAAYAGALNNDDNYNYQVENGLIVVAYKDGSPAHVHQLDSKLLFEFWHKWLLRLDNFVEQK